VVSARRARRPGLPALGHVAPRRFPDAARRRHPAVYARVASFEFINFDDPGYVSENPHVLSGLSRDGFVWAFTTTRQANWHPLTWLSPQLDAELFASSPRGFHATNVVLHVANVLLLFFLFARLTGSEWRSALVAGLVALHPLHVESVAWIAERKDVLSTALGLLTFHFWVRSLSPRGRVWRVLALAAASCVAAVVAQAGGGVVRSLTQHPFTVRAANAASS